MRSIAASLISSRCKRRPARENFMPKPLRAPLLSSKYSAGSPIVAEASRRMEIWGRGNPGGGEGEAICVVLGEEKKQLKGQPSPEELENLLPVPDGASSSLPVPSIAGNPPSEDLPPPSPGCLNPPEIWELSANGGKARWDPGNSFFFKEIWVASALKQDLAGWVPL
ncbi:hypothetical protein ACLOJK_020459 [Asimina triloba]